MSEACPRTPWISYSYRNLDDWDGRPEPEIPACVLCLDKVKPGEHLYFSLEKRVTYTDPGAVGGLMHWECPPDPNDPNTKTGFAKYCLNRFEANRPIHAPGTRTLAKLDPIDIENVFRYNDDELRDPQNVFTRAAFRHFLAQPGFHPVWGRERILGYGHEYEHLPAGHPRKARDRAQLIDELRAEERRNNESNDPTWRLGDE